jgi:hypothetical protein
VIFYHPEGKLKFVSVGLIGSLGVVTGLNEAGISISWSACAGATRLARTARAVLEQARTLEQAEGILKARKLEPSGAVLIGSRAEGKALLLLRSGDEWVEQEMKNGAVGSGKCWPGEGADRVGLAEVKELAGAGCAGDARAARLGVVYGPVGNRVWIAWGRSAAGSDRWAEVDFASETLREPGDLSGTLNSNP